MLDRPRSQYAFMALCLALSGVIFAVDLLLPAGVAAGAPHAAVVLLSVALGLPGFSLVLAVLASILTVVGAWLSPPDGVGLWFIVSNRLLSLFTIWVAAILGRMLSRERLRRGEAAEELSQNLARTRSILDTAVDGFISIDERGRIEAVNPAAEAMFGYSEEELLGQNVKVLMPEPYKSEHDRYLEHYLHTGEKKIIGIGREVVGLHKDGTVFPLELAVSEVEMEGQRAFIGTVRDISERRRLEEQFLQSQKMEAIGRLAGGVAHDFNTLLSSILGYAEMVLDALPGDLSHPIDRTASVDSSWLGKARRAAEQIRRSADRGAALTRQLLTFSRQERQRRELVDLNEVVHGLWDMLDRLVGEQVELSLDLEGWDLEGGDLESGKQEGALCRVEGDRAQMEQVVVNLVVNAVDAMPGGGRITILTENLGPKGRDGVMLQVGDTGEGMGEAVRRRIFEPFFTTKERGKGTGLGLSTVYGIVTQGGGSISVESEEGGGTTFRLIFPWAAAPLGAAPDAGPVAGPGEDRVGALVEDEARESPAVAGETVLLVEDDAMFRGLLEEVLGDQGYEVLAAGEPKAALAICGGRQVPVDLVVTDLVMPGMTGDALVRELQERYPGIRAILMSGYSDEQLEERVRTDGSLPMMRKPFSTKELARRVREVLDSQ